ncbi:MAG: PEGA domain-containing protein [Bacteroidia bacterium]|nr:PEGA domain-containing protein [Bacteroidia bacterium]
MKKLLYFTLFSIVLLLNNCTVKLYEIYYDPKYDQNLTVKSIDNIVITPVEESTNIKFNIRGDFQNRLPLYNSEIIKKTVSTKYCWWQDLGALVIFAPFAIALSPIIIPVSIAKSGSEKNKYLEDIETAIQINGDHSLIQSSSTIKYQYNKLNLLDYYYSLFPFVQGIAEFKVGEPYKIKSKNTMVPLNSINPSATLNRTKAISPSEIKATIYINNELDKTGNCSNYFIIDMKSQAIKSYLKGDSIIDICFKIGTNEEIINGKNDFCFQYETKKFLPPKRILTETININPPDATLLLGSDPQKMIKIKRLPYIEKSPLDFNPSLNEKYIKVERSGYKTHQQYLSRTENDRTTIINLVEIQTGYLKLTSSENNVEIYLDNEYQGLLSKQTPFNKKIEVGNHQVSARKKFFKTNTVNVIIEPNSVLAHNFNLIPATSNWDENTSNTKVIQAVGSLTVVTERKDLVVYIDGNKKVPSFEITEIAAGEYDMRIVGNGIDKVIHITIEDGKKVFIDLDKYF